MNRVTDMRQGQRQVYDKNPANWDSITVDGNSHRLPFAERVVLHQIRDEAAAIAALTSGQVDMMEAVRWQFVDQLKASAPRLQLQKYNQYAGTYIALRVDKAPFNDVRVRRALNIAVDHKAILNTVMNGNGEILNYPFNSA